MVLRFEKGRIVESSSSSNSDRLVEILDSDEGARYIGEFAIAFNPMIREPMLDILFDEKIAGSFHFTPGQAYEEANNGNKSQVHWDMVNIQRSNLLDSSSPNPSVETLLHVFLPHKFVDHTHATPFLILANLPNAEDICKEIFGERLAIVPYIMPGFGLAKKAADIYEENQDVEGLLLLNHGHFTFGSTAQKSYDLIISHTNEVASYFNLKKPTSYKIRLITMRLY